MKPKIKFNKKDHTYFIDGIKYDSVTTIISDYFSKFDADKIAKKLAFFNKIKIKKLIKEGKIDEAKELMGKGVRYYKKLWKNQQEYGSEVHKEIQDYIITLDDPNYPESLHGIKWLNKYCIHIKPYEIMSEVKLYNEKYKIAGTCDVLILRSDMKTVDIIDWKVVNEIKKDSYQGKQCKLGLPDSNFWKYTLQLNMYAWMLKERGYIIGNLKIVQLTPNNAKVFNVPVLLDKIGLILEDRK